MYTHSFVLLASFFITALSINCFKAEYHSQALSPLGSVAQNLLATDTQQYNQDEDCKKSSEEDTCHRGTGRISDEAT